MADSPRVTSPRDHRRKWSVIRNQQQEEGPPYRSCHTANVYKHQMIVFGGISPKQAKLGDIYSLDLDDEEWTEIKPKIMPVNLTRYCHAAEVFKNYLIIMGGIGEDGSRRNDIKVLDLESREWMDQQVAGPLPTPRSHHGSALFGSKLIIFGGLSGLSAQSPFTYQLGCTATWQWTQPVTTGTPPTGRLFSTVCMWQNKFVVFGGYTGSKRLNDVHLLDLSTMTWSEPLTRGDKPPARYGQGGGQSGSKLIVCGGTTNDREPIDDVYSLDLETMEWVLLQEARLPRARKHHTACFYNNSKMIVYGGSTTTYGKIGEIDTLHLGSIAELGELAFDEVKGKIRSGLNELKGLKPSDTRSEELMNDSLRMLKVQFTRLRKEHDALQREIDRLNKEREQFETSKEKMALYSETHKPDKVVKLNVGGHKFETTVSTLRNDSQSMLASMFSGRYAVPTTEDGYVFIDRDGTHFRYILNYLRDGTINLPQTDLVLCLDLIQEAQFYQMDALARVLKKAVKSRHDGQLLIAHGED